MNDDMTIKHIYNSFEDFIHKVWHFASFMNSRGVIHIALISSSIASSILVLIHLHIHQLLLPIHLPLESFLIITRS